MLAGSGSAFVNVRLGYVQNRRDQPKKWGTCHPVTLKPNHDVRMRLHGGRGLTGIIVCAGSGSAFVNVRLGYVQNRRDQPEKWGTCHPVAATAGIAGVECSTSGVFFQTFPNVS